MEMLQLRYFYESAKSESFAKTAKKYMVPTTSVSASVRRLESELGCSLFDRTGNRITLNAKGREFLESVSHIFFELDNAVLSLASSDDNKRQKISIYAPNMRTTAAFHINTYRKSHPQTLFSIGVDFNETDFDKYDILFVKENSEKFSEYEGFEFRTYQVKVEAAEDNPLCERKLTLKQLKDYPFVTTGIDNEIYKTFTRACEHEGFTPNYIIECNDYTCAERLQRQGVGLGVTLTRGEAGASSGMVHLNITDFNKKFTVYVYYKKKNYHGAVKGFIDYLKTVSG